MGKFVSPRIAYQGLTNCSKGDDTRKDHLTRFQDGDSSGLQSSKSVSEVIGFGAPGLSKQHGTADWRLDAPMASHGGSNAISKKFTVPRLNHSNVTKSQNGTADIRDDISDKNASVVSKFYDRTEDKENKDSRLAFKVYFTKLCRKKRKVYEDGVLLHSEDRLFLYRMDGRVISSSRYRMEKNETFVQGSTVNIGTNTAEIEESLPLCEYDSGRVFLPASHDSCVRSSGQKAGQKAAVRERFRPVNSKLPSVESRQSSATKVRMPQAMFDATRKDALVLYHGDNSLGTVATVVDPHLSKHLRTHQREGVEFLFNCMTDSGLDSLRLLTKSAPNSLVRGCILADDMGLGKTLQTIATVFTLLKQGPKGRQGPTWCKKAIVVTPSSLVRNWENEFKKWLGTERIQPLLIEGSDARDEAKRKADLFRVGAVHQILILSYETFRKMVTTFSEMSCVDLLVCDEAHRLKCVSGNQTISALKSCRANRRILLTGTPVQNDLVEFYAMVDFACPGLWGSDIQTFRRIFQAPIEAGTDKNASNKTRALASSRTKELHALTKRIILRRTSEVNKRVLPCRTDLSIFVRLSPTQVDLYQNMVNSYLSCYSHRSESGTEALGLVHRLRQLCTHPCLIGKEKKEMVDGVLVDGPSNKVFNADFSPHVSVKLALLDTLLTEMNTNHPTDKIVFVSNSTRTLNLVELLCKKNDQSFLRLDGSTKSSDRQRMVDRFNLPVTYKNPNVLEKVFLLSSKAGGCGLNLIGANRLCLIDLDWNPAVDMQATARIWRDGQTKPVYIYRLLAAGTIEERVFQRQIMKISSTGQALSEPGNSGKLKSSGFGAFSRSEIKQLFNYSANTACQTFDLIEQGAPQSMKWTKYEGPELIPDPVLRSTVATLGSDYVTWVHWKDESNVSEESIEQAEEAFEFPKPPTTKELADMHCSLENVEQRSSFQDDDDEAEFEY